MPRLLLLLAVVAATVTVGGVSSFFPAPDPAVAQVPDGDGDGTPDGRDYDDPNADPDSDGVANAQDNCPGSFRGNPPESTGKPGCSALFWTASASNGSGNLGIVVDQGFIQLASFCNPGVCKTTYTLSAGKRAREQLGLDKAVIGRKTVSQKFRSIRGDYRIAQTSFAEFDLPRKVVRKMDDLDKVELKARFEVSSTDSPEMKRVKFTESGTIKLDRRRGTNARPDPPGQGLQLFRGACPQQGDCKNVNGD